MKEPVIAVHLEMRSAEKTAESAPINTGPAHKKDMQPARPRKSEIADKPAEKHVTSEHNVVLPARHNPEAGQSINDAGAGRGISDAGETGFDVDSNNSEGRPGRNESFVEADSLRVIKKILPEYPAFSRKRKEEGTVKVIITIENGRVVRTELDQSSGFERLDASAMRAAGQWRFDHSGTIRARIPFTFKLEK